MDVPFWVWALTVGLILGMLIFDLVGHVRTPHAPSLRESAIWSGVYVGIAVDPLVAHFGVPARRGGRRYASVRAVLFLRRARAVHRRVVFFLVGRHVALH